MEGLIKLRNHAITLNIPEESIVYIDKEKIQSVFSNLQSNAIKYTPIGGNIVIKSKIKKNFLKTVTFKYKVSDIVGGGVYGK